MSDDKLIERARLLERMRDAMEHARIHGVEPSAYFLDKCNSEAGFGNDVEIEDTTQPFSLAFPNLFNLEDTSRLGLTPTVGRSNRGPFS